MTEYERKALDPSLYYLEPSVAKFFKKLTGINDDEQLKTHIFKIQEEAYRAFSYPCIRLFGFTRLLVTKLPKYNELLKLGETQHDPILLEVGTGFGTDIRKIVDDGYPAQNVVATDITSELWEIGHRLFRSDAESFPVKFVQADIFDDTILSFEAAPSLIRPDMKILTELTPLKGHVSAILIQSVFHLFDYDHQTLLARRLAALLSPTPGSLITGYQIGASSARDVILSGRAHFVHSPATWETMWSTIFPSSGVEYSTVLIDVPQDLAAATVDLLGMTQILVWSVRRL